MPELYSTTRRGHGVRVEADNSLFVVTRLRLFLDGFRADERSAVWGEVRLHGELRDGESLRPVTVEVSVGVLGDVTRCVLVERDAEYPLRKEGLRSRSEPASKEREPLNALRERGSRVSAAEAAMETSLSVKEADAMLSELAGGGHLSVEREGATLIYALPTNARPELEER